MKKLFRGCAALLLSFSVVVPALAYYQDVSYTVHEVPDGGVLMYYHRRAVQFAEQQGIMTGYPDNTFRPSVTVNRAELMKILVEASGSFGGAGGNCFPDVTDQWFAQYVCYAKDRGWVQGYPDGKFHPEKKVTLAEALKMLTTSRGYTTTRPIERGYPVDAWYAPYLETLFQKFIIHDALLKGDRPVLLGKEVARENIAEYLYLTYLSEKKIALDLKNEMECDLPGANTFALETSMTSNLVKGYIQKDNERCLVSNSFNPFEGIGPNNVNFHLKIIGQQGASALEGSHFQGPVIDGKVRFEAEGYGTAPLDFYTSGTWEYDLRTHILRQID